MSHAQGWIIWKQAVCSAISIVSIKICSLDFVFKCFLVLLIRMFYFLRLQLLYNDIFSLQMKDLTYLYAIFSTKS
jgi:hypothetical protein